MTEQERLQAKQLKMRLVEMAINMAHSQNDTSLSNIKANLEFLNKETEV